MTSWGSWSKISNLLKVGDVSFFDLKVRFLFSPLLGRLFLRKMPILYFLWLFIFIEDFMKDFTKDFIKDFNKGFNRI